MMVKIAKYFSLVAILMTGFVSGNVQAQRLVGSNGRSHWDNPVDSALFKNQEGLYTGRRDNGKLFTSWLEDPYRYYPAMYEAWAYCLRTCPDQRNLYLDGRVIYSYMLDKARTQNDSSLYYGKLMDLYDQRIQNLTAINANVRRQELKSSVAGMAFNKFKEWYQYYGKRLSDNDYDAQAYRQYQLQDIESLLSSTVESGQTIGGDVAASDLKSYFISCLNHYNTEKRSIENDASINEISKQKYKEYLLQDSAIRTPYQTLAAELKAMKAKGFKNQDAADRYNADSRRLKLMGDSITPKLNRLAADFKQAMALLGQDKNARIGALKQKFIAQYNLINDVAERQKTSLGSDFVAASDADANSLKSKGDSAMTLSKSYDQLIQSCQDYMAKYVGLDESDMAGIIKTYSDSLEKNKNNLLWLTRLENKCQSAVDANPTNEFYQKVEKYLENAQMAMTQTSGAGTVKVIVNPANEYLRRANSEWTAGAEAHRKENYDVAISHYEAAISNYRKAGQVDPGNINRYNSYISQLNKQISNAGFWVGKGTRK